jgi:phosphate transport system permease protein
VIEGILMLSSAATSITIIWIVFLFIEGAGFLKPIDKVFIGSKWVKSVSD